MVATARSRSRRPSTTAPSSPKRTDSSARRSSARPGTGSATAASTSVSASRASSASAAASRSLAPRCAVSGWATSSWPLPSPTSGTSRASRRRLGYLLDLAPEGPREGHLLRRVHDHVRGRGAPYARPALAGGAGLRRAPAGREPPRLRPGGPRQEARDRPRRAGGRGRQGRRAPQGARGRRARDEAAARPCAARDRPPRRGVDPLQEPQGPGPGGRRAALPRAARPLRHVLRRFDGCRGAAEAPGVLRPGRGGRAPPRDHPHRQGPEEDPCAQAPQGRLRVPADHQQAPRAWCWTASR